MPAGYVAVDQGQIYYDDVGHGARTIALSSAASSENHPGRSLNPRAVSLRLSAFQSTAETGLSAGFAIPLPGLAQCGIARVR
jgi:hypothetical protein